MKEEGEGGRDHGRLMNSAMFMKLYLNWSSLNGRSLNFEDGIHLRRLIFCRSGDDLEIRQNLGRA